MADEAHSSTPYISLSNLKPVNETTYLKAISEIRSRIKNASHRAVHIYSFNIRPDQLGFAHSLLGKQEGSKSMRVTYNEDYNFIIRYMPGPAHESAHNFWSTRLSAALALLIHSTELGCISVGTTTYQLGLRKKQPDDGIRPDSNPSHLPSIVVEVGSSESMTQLKIDARLWLEYSAEIKLVILISIDPPIPPSTNVRITIELWRSFPPSRPHRPHTASQEREAHMVWRADWTHTTTPFYVLLSDIFRGPPPAAYGHHDRVFLNTVAWREAIIRDYV